MSSCASEQRQRQLLLISCVGHGLWCVQERFEDPEVVYIERDLPANGAHAGAGAKGEAAPSGLDDGVPEYKGSAAKVLLAPNFSGKQSVWLRSWDMARFVRPYLGCRALANTMVWASFQIVTGGFEIMLRLVV